MKNFGYELMMPEGKDLLELLAAANKMKAEDYRKKGLEHKAINIDDILFSIRAYLKMYYNIDMDSINLET